MNFARALRLQLIFVLFALVSISFAGGPLIVGGPSFGVDGKPFVWDNSAAISYTTDGGAFGNLTNTAANTMVADAFRTWSSVSTAKISFQRTGSIQGITDGDVSTIAEFDQASALCDTGQTPIVYDDTGEIFTNLFGDPNVVGFAGPCSVNSNGKIVSAFAAFSGPSARTISQTLVQTVMVHEFGHLIGLDHSQVDCKFGCYLDDNFALPTMYYTLVTEEQSTLAPDDIAWVSKLYPSSSYAANYGTITGRVYFSDAKSQVQDAVLVARRVDDKSTGVDESRSIAISAISGNYFTGNPGQPFTANYLPCVPVSACPNGFAGDNTGGDQFGSRSTALIGYFEIPVPAGQYTVEVRPISASYGPVEIGPVAIQLELPGPAEYWTIPESATDESFEDPFFFADYATAAIVTVTAGSQVPGIDIILNSTAPSLDEYEGGPVSPPATATPVGGAQ